MQLLQRVDTEWWWCDYDDKQGYVPANYVEAAKSPVKSSKVSKFQTIKRGMEVDVLIFSLMKLSNQSLGGKVPRDSFLQWALEHEMDLCFNALEKFDLRVNKQVTTPTPMEAHAPAPPSSTATSSVPVSSAPSFSSTSTRTTTETATTTTSAVQTHAEPETVNGVIVPETAMRSEASESTPRISPELATVLRAAGIADKELDDSAMAEFVSYFIDKHAPKVTGSGTAAGRRRPKHSNIDDTVHRRPLPVPTTTAPEPTGAAPAPAPAPAPPAVVITLASDDITAPTNTRVSLHDQIKAGKKLRAARKKTNLATLSKKDLTGLGLLLRVQIDSRRNVMAMSDDDASSSSDGEFD